MILSIKKSFFINLFIYINFFNKFAFTAQNLDTSFGRGLGYITTQNSQGFQINKIKIQPDGKIVAVGLTQAPNTQAIIARYNTDGTLDNTFGVNGIVQAGIGSSLSTTVLNDVAIDSSGNIVVVGFTYDVGSNTSILVARYTTAGVLDSTFASGGVFSASFGNGSSLNSVVIQPDDKIVVAGLVVINGTPNGLIARLTTSGTLDTTFNSTGYIIGFVSSGTAINDVKIDNSGNIVVAGYYNPGTTDEQFIIIRYTSAGALDTTFNSTGMVLGSIGNRSHINAIAIDSSNNIVVGGFINFGSADQFMVARYTSSGALDTTFNSPNGFISQLIGNGSQVNDVVIQSDGKIVVGGFYNNYTNQAVVARYTSSGVLDTTFGNGGVISLAIGNSSQINGLDIQSSDGRIVAGGFEIDSTTNEAFGLLVRFNLNNTDFINFNSPIANDATINTKIPTISGTSSAGAGATVQLVLNGSVIATTTTTSGGAWSFGNSNVLPVGTNLLQVNLVVSGSTVVSNAIELTIVDNLGEDSAFAYSTSTQTTTSLNAFQTITFSAAPILNTWTTSGVNTFVCRVTGKYLIEYSAETGISPALTVNTNISIRALKTSAEIAGSQANNLLSVGSGVTSVQTCAKSFIINVNAGDTIQFQYATDTSGGGILAATGNGTTRPSISVTIARLQ